MTGFNDSVGKTGRKALLALSMVGMAKAGFAQTHTTDSLKTSFQMPQTNKSWLSLRAGTGFNTKNPVGDAAGVGIETRLWKNFSVNAELMGNMADIIGLYDHQTKYLALPNGVTKESSLLVKYAADRKITDHLVFAPYLDAGLRSAKTFAAAGQSICKKSIGADAGLELQYYPMQTGQHNNVFLSATANFRVDNQQERNMRGLWLGLSIGTKFK
jgi:hypothetical protein